MAERRGQIGQRMAGAVARVRGESTIAPGRAAGTPLGPRGRRSVPGVRSIGTAGVAGVTAALVLALAGCTGAPDPVVSSPGVAGTVIPTSPTTPSPSPSPTTIAAPERPAAMDRDDAEGAIAAATYFISLYPYVYASGDLAEWSAMSDPQCVFCTSVSGNVDTMLAKGDHLGGGAVTWLAPPEFTNHENGLSEVRLGAAQAATTEINSSGEPITETAASEADIIVLLTFAEAHWRIRGVDLSVRT